MDSSIKVIISITLVIGISFGAFNYFAFNTREQNYQKINTIASTTLLEDLNPETILVGRQYLNITDFTDANFMEYHLFKSFFYQEDNKTIIYSESNFSRFASGF